MHTPKLKNAYLLSTALALGLSACPSDSDSDSDSDAVDDGTGSSSANASTDGAGDDGVDDDDGDDDGPATDTAGGDGLATGTAGDDATDMGDDPDSGSGDTGPTLEELLMCDEPLEVGLPLFGPGIDPEAGGFVGDAETYVVSTTQIIVPNDPAVIGQFDGLVGDVVGQLMMTPGLVGLSFAGETACGSQRTLSIWEDTAAMFAFTSSGAHVVAMGETTTVSLSGRVTHWEINAADGPPSWDDALAMIEKVSPLAVYD